MKLWTIQRQEVLKTIANQGIYYPNFNESQYVKAEPEIKKLFDTSLTGFLNKNLSAMFDFDGCPYEGLVFCFGAILDGKPSMIPDKDTFFNLINERISSIESLWNYITRDISDNEPYLLELDYEDGLFNPVPIDINDYQALLPPVFPMGPYTAERLNKIEQNLVNGTYEPSVLPSGIAQFHAPYISIENVTNVYKLINN
ncbi:hypothetical protein [Limosilactobacillus avium]|uniref:hypothetical protein n=1 Tax=Limosilactobacillus avium TaxID=2991831 RepID=UPI0024BB055B|nr:hypothetical protein [Limosilactobacillus avium]